MPLWLASLSGEIGTKKAGTQQELKRSLLETLKSRAQTLGFDLEVKEHRNRFLIKGPAFLEGVLKSQFGLSAFSRLFVLPANDPLSGLSFQELLPERPFVFTIYLTHFEDQEAKERGLLLKRKLLDLLEIEARKRLSSWDNHPPEEIHLRLEAYSQEIWLLTKRIKAPGGFPPGSGGKVLVLFSGGPDSLLSAYLLGRRGQEVELVFFDDGEEERYPLVRRAASSLAYFFEGLSLSFWRVGYVSVLEALKRLVPERERCFFCRAAMLAIATRLLEKTGAQAIATGEILGEQASQTLPGLLFSAGEQPVLRPVLAFNKDEVYQALREAGLEGIAHLPLPRCPYAPKRPRTRPTKSPLTLSKILRKLKGRAEMGWEVIHYQTKEK